MVKGNSNLLPDTRFRERRNHTQGGRIDVVDEPLRRGDRLYEHRNLIKYLSGPTRDGTLRAS